MALIVLVRDYLRKMLGNTGGMKALLLDEETTAITGSVLSQTEALQQEVFLIEKLEKKDKDDRQYLKAVVFCRPTRSSIEKLKWHLQNPIYPEYFVYFSNIVTEDVLKELADCDRREVVQCVQEYFIDFRAIDQHHFTFELKDNASQLVPLNSAPQRANNSRERVVEGLLALCLAMKRRPAIRYSGKSEQARLIADTIRARMEADRGLYDFRRTDTSPTLLILDRVDDPVTPLLLQWTYQAMIHELLGIHNNRVDMRKFVSNSSKLEQQQLVLSAEQDNFFADHMYDNYGDIGIAVKGLVDQFSAKQKATANISSISDMQKFIDQFPEFRKQSGTVSKHVSLMTEMSKIVDSRSLLNVSQQEQEVACMDGASAAYDGIVSLIDDPKLTADDKLRLVLLYALRYERDASRVGPLVENLASAGVGREKVSLVRTMLTLCGANKRSGDLYGQKQGFFSRSQSYMAKSLKGVENIYTQHTPAILSIIESLGKGRLKDSEYPFSGAGNARDKSSEIIIYIVGGTTYEEARFVSQLNTDQLNMNSASLQKMGWEKPIKVVLGGGRVINSSQFLRDLLEVQEVSSRR